MITAFRYLVIRALSFPVPGLVNSIPIFGIPFVLRWYHFVDSIWLQKWSYYWCISGVYWSVHDYCSHEKIHSLHMAIWNFFRASFVLAQDGSDAFHGSCSYSCNTNQGQWIGLETQYYIFIINKIQETYLEFFVVYLLL